MKNKVKLLANKAIYAAFVVLGAASVCAEGIREDLKDDNGNVVGYKVTGLGKDKNETAAVFTTTGADIPWTVPYDLENVQFLVVGGGGGGGAAYKQSSTSSNLSGGAGGGGGGVGLGYIYTVSKGTTLIIKVGKGSEGGAPNANNGAASGAGGASTISLSNDGASTLLVKANGGGRDRGASTKQGGQGGSGGGSRNKADFQANATKGNIGEGAEELLFAEFYGNKGGAACNDSARPSGGGGGANIDPTLGVGDSAWLNTWDDDGVNKYCAGDGGLGFTSSITGEAVIYGSGGGGGSSTFSTTVYIAGKGGRGVDGNGAGNGALSGDGGSGLPNQGGGGGGAGGEATSNGGNGGDGGSGIVVIRYVELPVKPNAVASLIYNGEDFVGVLEGKGYKVVGNVGCEVGTYTATVSLDDDRISWSDGTKEDITVAWKIWPRMPDTGMVGAENGYVVRGLGDNGNEVAVVFTNENATAISWKAPSTINSAHFLVVGGGGGGGADFNTSSREAPYQGGAGGGGGGVVVGSMPLDANNDISITVGAGGLGGLKSDNSAPFGDASSGSASKIKVGNDDYIIAYGGGGDGGSNKLDAKIGNIGKVGGSSAGSRPGQTEVADIEAAFIHESLISSSHAYGHVGGAGAANAWYSSWYAAAGGGGGANEYGYSPSADFVGGKGGEGLPSSITGKELVYGSGGGGGTISRNRGGLGGTGAGDGNISTADDADGNSALPNQGGGGGGAGRMGNGGNGGSGIVAFRFEYNEVAAVNGYGYTDIAEAINAANGGTVTLVENVGDFELNSSITLKLNGYTTGTITLTDAAVQLTASEGLVVETMVDGYEVVYADGVYGLVEKKSAVAQIGEQTYETLEAAFAAATEGQTITLLSDAAWTKDYGTGAPTIASVIDLGGKTLKIADGNIRFSTITLKNGNIVIDPAGSYTGNGVFYMFDEKVLTLDNVKLTAENFTGYSIFCMEGNSDLVLQNGTEITVKNANIYGIVAAVSEGEVTIDNAKITGETITGRGFLNGNYTIKGTSEITLTGVTKDGFYIGAGDTLNIQDTAKVAITLNADGDDRYGINIAGAGATYTKAETATVTATLFVPAVAKIGETPYITLADAVANATEGQTITLISDVQLAETLSIPAGKTVTLDLNGKQITSGFQQDSTTKHIYPFDVYGTFTIKDTVGNGSITGRGILVQSGSKLTIESGAVYAIDSNGGSALYMYGGDVVINGGHIEQMAEGTYNFAINGLGGTVTVNNGWVGGNHGAIAAGGATVVINGGNLVCTGTVGMTDNVLYSYDTGSITINGGTFTGDSDTAAGGCCVYDANGGATINGGTFGNTSGGDVWGTTGTTIKGGTFSNLTEKQHIAAGYELNADGQVVAKPAVAKIGDTPYATLQAALAAAQAGETITLLADIAATEVILLDKNLTINGNGHKVTSSATRVFRVTTADTEVTLNDVNMVSTAVRVGTNDIRGISIDNVNNVKLTLNNCSVDFTDASANDWAYAVNVTGGSGHTLTVNGGTYEGANVINVRGANHTVTVQNATLNCTYPQNSLYEGACVWVQQENGSSLTATGNTFNGSNAVALNIGTGTSLTESGNTDNTVIWGVAKIGNQKYASLADALAAAKSGDTIKLLADISSSEIITINKAITLDGNGKKLTSTAGRAINEVSTGTVTIKNLTIIGKGDCQRAINIIDETGITNIENVTASGTEKMLYTIYIWNGNGATGTEVNIKDSTLTGWAALRVSVNGTTVNVENSHLIGINTQKYTGTHNNQYSTIAIANEAVSGVVINVTGGSITAKSNEDCEYQYIIGHNLTQEIDAVLNTQLILDGEHTKYLNVGLEKTEVSVRAEYADELAAEGFLVGSANENGLVSIVAPVAKIGETPYATFQAALAAARAGDTITLLDDVTLTGKLTIAEDITIDGNGHSIIANHTAFILETSSDCEFKNVTLDTNNKAKGVKIASGNVIFDNVTIPNSNKSGAITVAGMLTIKNYFKVESTYQIFDARSGSIYVEEGTVFDFTSRIGLASPADDDLKAAVDTNGKPYFCAYGSTTYYRTLTSIAVTITDLTLLDDVSLNKDITVKGTLNLNGKTLTLAEGKVLKTGGNLTITGGAFANPILLTSASYTVTAPDGLNVITNVEGKKVVYENGVYKLVDIVYAAQIGEQKYETLQAALDAAVAGAGSVMVEILSDIDMTGKTWTPVKVDPDSFVTVNGNSKTITGLSDMLFASTWAGTSGLVINDLTIADSTIVHDENDSAGNIGVGAFVGYPQASATVTLNNCHLENSTVKGGHWTGGLVGIAGGYNGTDGPVFMTLTIDGCSVTGSTITSKGSAGGIIGHGSCSAWTDVIIVNSTVSNNTITSTGSSDNKAGSVMGTIGAAGQPTTVNGVTKTGGMSVSVTTAGNTVTSADKVITTIYGRQGTETGLLEIAGGTYESYPIEENVEYAAPKDGYIIFENADGKYGVKEGAYVAQINGVKYETLASALAAAQNDAVVELLWAEGNAPIAMNGLVFGKSVTITGSATVDWSKGFLFVGRGGEGNGTVIFDNANLESDSNNASYGIHVSGREKNTNNKYDGTVVINNSTIVLDYLIDKGAMTMTNSTLTVKNGFAVGGRPASETESGVDATATFDLTNGSTLIVNNHNGMGLGYEAIGVMTIDSTSTFQCTQSFLVTDKGVLKSAGNIFGDIVKSANAQIELTGGIYTDEEVQGWCVEPYAALPNLNNQYVVGVKPTATVNSFGVTTIPAGEYGVWNGSSYTGTSTEDMPLSFVMQFLADQNEEDMKTSPFADWYGDFVITFTGIENGSFTADGCYLAGHYGEFGWVKVPVDGMIIENGARYPVMLGVGLGQKYDYICSSVEDFKCAMFLTPKIIEANPNLKVKLELAVVDNSQGSDSAASALVKNDKVFSVTEYEYGAEAFAPALPTATVTSIDAPEGTPLTFALNFKADDVTDAQLAYYRDWYADFVLTITGLSEEGVTFNTDGTADGYLAGQYDAWSENWVSVPFEDVTLRNGESIKIMEYAATLMGQSGLKLTYNDVYSFVKNFDCGVYFTPEFLAANPDMKVSLSLRMYKTGDATDEGIAIGEMEEFSAPTVVAKIGSTPYATLEEALEAAQAGDTITLLKNVELSKFLKIEKSLALELGAYTIARNGGSGVLYVNNADANVTIDATVGGVTGPQAVWVNAGTVTINGGTFTGVGGEAVYATGNGKVVINGGTFSSNIDGFVINQKDGDRTTSSIVINGGTFVGFDPRNNAAETAGTTFMAAGKYTFAEGGNYIVVTPEDYILNGVSSDSATVGDVDLLLAGAVTVTKDGEKYVATATYTFKVTAVDTVNPEKSSYELTGGKLRPGKTVAVKYIDLATGTESWEKPESDIVTFKLVIK